MEKKPVSRPWSLRRKIILGSVLAVVVLGLALGLGLGLTLGRDDGDDDGGDGNLGPSEPPLPTPTGKLRWTPRVNDTWQIVLQSNIDLASDATSVTPDVDVYDIDLFDTPQNTIDTLHRLGKKVICYFSGGSYENWRPDADDFKPDDLGKNLDGWAGERWLRLDSENVRAIMKKRIDMARDKDCDGIDPDNVDGYQNDNGLDLNSSSSISFMQYLSSIAAPLNLTMGLKNAGDIIPTVLPIVQFSVNEQCVANQECDTFRPFVDAGKPVFHIEYPDDAGEGKNVQGLKKDVVSKFCSRTGDAQGSAGFSTVLKKMNLDGWVEYCDGDVQVTAINQTASHKI